MKKCLSILAILFLPSCTSEKEMAGGPSYQHELKMGVADVVSIQHHGKDTFLSFLIEHKPLEGISDKYWEHYRRYQSDSYKSICKKISHLKHQKDLTGRGVFVKVSSSYPDGKQTINKGKCW